MCGLLLFIETKEERIICSEHGVQYSAVLWAYGGSRFTKDFDRTTAWLAFPLPRKAVKEYLRIDWETEAEQIYSSSMTLAVSSSDSAFSRISSYEELSSRDAFNRTSFFYEFRENNKFHALLHLFLFSFFPFLKKRKKA